jgi:hypothetical protein
VEVQYDEHAAKTYRNRISAATAMAARENGERRERELNVRKHILLVMALFIALVALTTQAFAQSLTTGAISGRVTDATGAVIQNAPAGIKSLDTGASQSTTTNQAGEFHFGLLKPGRYTVSVTQPGFEKSERTVDVALGGDVASDFQLTVGQSTQTVEVTEAAPLVSSESSSNTSFTRAQVEQLPSAGGDLTNIAFTAPGVVVNGMGGYGNFTLNGLPATSNLFTINGENDMDPYFNINNSGASNLTLGQNEISEATVVANPYSGQYGQLSGAQVTYLTKSGTNEFHGNMIYWWNGRYMNANDWFNNFYGAPRPFSNANQWAGSVGGPVMLPKYNGKNKTFFFVDAEGMRFVLPNVDSVTIPTTAFANAVLANVQAKQPAEYSTYQKMIGLWENAPGAAAAQPIANDSYCSSVVLAGFNPKTQACAAKFQATPTALASEWILAFKIDQKLGNNDNTFFRYKQDRGTQPTTISPINSAFDALSPQPSWDAQFNETHVFGPHATNSFTGTFSWYQALFSQGPQAAATFPYQIVTSGAVPFTGYNSLGSFPQGRNVTQYQIIDDYSLNKGNHTIKIGLNYRRYDVSDHNFFFNSPGVYFGYTSNGLQNFVNGVAYQYRKSLNASADVPIALWGAGFYATDEWAVRSNFKLTLAIRVEHNSNPVCQFNCFANFTGPFSSLASLKSSTPGSVPYSSDIVSGQHQAYQSTDMANISPRLGFSWSPYKDNKTVISGGVGIFYDNLAAGLVDNLLANPPSSVAIRVRPAAGTLPFDPAGAAATWSASAAAFSITKTYSQISSALSSLGAVFAAPSVTSIIGTMHSPQFQEWNLQVQRELTSSFLLTLNYTGNHGIHIPYSNAWPNAYDLYGIYPGVAGIAANVPVANYGTVTQIQTGAVSNYNGLNVTLTKRFSHSLAGHFNYTWGHALDEVSNGGIFTYGDSTLGQISPTSLRALNYGNADYDIRNLFSGDLIYNPSFHYNNKIVSQALNGWQLGVKVFRRSGLPFSVTDNNTALGNGGGSLLATPTGSYVSNCGEAAAVTPCLLMSHFLDSGAASFNNFTALSTQNRNQFRGPGFFDVDMSLYRTFKIRERASLAIGLQAFNAFNHPNFGLPDAGLGDATFGMISSMQGTPTSPYGNFLGFDSSPRVAQLTGKFVF